MLGAIRAPIPSCGFAPFRAYSRCTCPYFTRYEPLSWLSYRSAYVFQQEPPTSRTCRARVTLRAQDFSSSPRFALPLALRVYFTPLTPFGFPSGISPPGDPSQLFAGPCRLAVAPSVALSPPRFRRVLRRMSETPLEAIPMPLAGFTALLPPRVRASKDVTHIQCRSIPSWFFLFKAFSR